MILAGLQKCSLIDFPGKIGCVLFVTGCNFSCPYCHNPELARGEQPACIASTQAIEFLKSRRGLLEGVVVSGGEPTLAPGLFELCRAVKSLGYALKLDTNGSRPGVLERLVAQRLVDFVAMDIKAPLDAYAPFCREPQIQTKLEQSIRIIMTAAPAYEFRTTCVAPFATPSAIVAMAKTIQGAARYVLQPFNGRAVCLDASFSQRPNARLCDQQMQGLRDRAAAFVEYCLIR